MKNFFILLLILSIFLASCGIFAPGSQTQKDATTNILAFEDTNRNGKQDSGELPIPDVLIATQSNIHGGMTYTAQLTGVDGTTSISTTYTHFFDLVAFPPCGYEATTPVLTEASRKVKFGFAPVNSQPGLADFYILLWHDKNQDGVYQAGEIPLAGEMLYLDPGLAWGSAPDIMLGQLTTQTNSGGEAVANFGNSCGEVIVSIPNDWQPSITADEGVWEDGRYPITYKPGRTNIFLGVIPND